MAFPSPLATKHDRDPDPAGDIQWPPEASEEALVARHNNIKDWQITHGSLIKLARTDQTHSVLSRPIGVSMFPTLFPKSSFTHGLALQTVFNELYVKVAEDETWLHDTLKDMISSDPLATTLWRIHEQVKQEGYSESPSLGIFRSDYMLHEDTDTIQTPEGKSTTLPKLKQVEFNTFSCAGGSHANIVADMHHHLNRMGHSPSRSSFPSSLLPDNKTISSLTSAVASAHHFYSMERARTNESVSHLGMVVIFLVQPENINICDERPLEFGLWNQNPPIPTFRLEFPDDVLTHMYCDESRRLFFRPDPQLQSTRAYEVSVVYLRAGYELSEYNDDGIAARFMLERSHAIKCPSVLSHLTTFKKVQQALALPGALERFLPQKEAALIGDTFAPLLPLDNFSKTGINARKLALDPAKAANYVLKPSLEGGGHNVYGEDIPKFLSNVDKSLWAHYIMQETIKPPQNLKNILLSHRGIYRGTVVSELGVFGTVMWRRKVGGQPEIIHNMEAGWSFKTKASEIKEMSVIKGYGCFDCPFLVDDRFKFPAEGRFP